MGLYSEFKRSYAYFLRDFDRFKRDIIVETLV